MKSIVQSGRLVGDINAPASKSYAQRAIFAALLAPGVSYLENLTWSDDVLHAFHAALSLGAEAKLIGKTLEVHGSNIPRSSLIYAGESGLSSRMLSAILMVYNQSMELTGAGSLMSRPFNPILPVYDQLGVVANSNDGKLPIRLKGPIRQNDILIDGSLSSQFISGLLIGLPAVQFQYCIRIENMSSRPYIDMTIELLHSFGVDWEEVESGVFRLATHARYKSTSYEIEGDWSGAAFLIGAGLINGDLSIKNLNINSKQADRAIMDLFNNYIVRQARSIKIASASFSGFEFDATSCPDLFPPLAAIAVFANSKSRIKGVSRLKHKESDRGIVLQYEFGRLGIEVILDGDWMEIIPSVPRGAVVSANNDHRIAMALALLGLRADGDIIIEGAECISKSYPSFFDDLKMLGANIETTTDSKPKTN